MQLIKDKSSTFTFIKNLSGLNKNMEAAETAKYPTDAASSSAPTSLPLPAWSLVPEWNLSRPGWRPGHPWWRPDHPWWRPGVEWSLGLGWSPGGLSWSPSISLALPSVQSGVKDPPLHTQHLLIEAKRLHIEHEGEKLQQPDEGAWQRCLHLLVMTVVAPAGGGGKI